METTEYTCEICGKVSPSKRAFRNHCFSEGHHQFQCGFCQKAFIIQQAKDDHERMKHAAPATERTRTATGIFPDLLLILRQWLIETQP
jgi:hypothetical protein